MTATYRHLAVVPYQPLRITHLDRGKWDMDGSIAEGQGLSDAAIGFTLDQLEADHPATLAWERVVDEVIAEITPRIGDLLYAALQRRLPWTWEPDDAGA